MLMLPPYKRPKAYPQPFRPPVAIRRLPLTLLRDQLYPRQPEVVGQAVEEYYRYMAGQPQPQLLPQRMAFQQWKTGPNEARRPWWHSVMSLHAMQTRFRSGVPTRVAHIEQTVNYGPVQGARTRGADTPLVPPPGAPTPVLERAVRASGPTSSFEGREAPPPQAFAYAAETMLDVARQRGELKLTRAMTSARAAIARGRMTR